MDNESSEAPSCNMCDAAPDNMVFCEGCEAYYCDEPCWGQLKSHRKQGLGAGGVPHGKSRPEIVQMIKKSMAEPKNDFEEKEQHVKDVDSVWFGLSQDDGGEPALADYRRYATVMMESNPENSAPRYPGLVSFIGPTGSGKSTLIKLLIDPAQHGEGESGVDVPVIGRRDCDVPTSSDVHLYIDPGTTTGNRPILFADCEGFEGGERDPMAQQTTTTVEERRAGATHDIRRATHAVMKRVLKWASRNSQQSEQTSKRQYAVSEMYPRIFHAFSDVVVFVLNNPKTMEDVVEKLLKWADANHSTSINMPCKPHAIIAINKSQNSSPKEHWHPGITTIEFFKSMGNQINKNPTILKYVEKWRNSNAPINDIQELFQRYYWTINVVRLPEKSRYELMHQQRDALREVITECCQSSFRKRKDVSILPDVDEFGMYLSLAFDHFSQTLDKPFDYVKASIEYRPPPETLESNLLEFIILVEKALNAQGKVENILNTITKIVASYFILDSARKQRMGQPQHWFATHFTDLKTGRTASSHDAADSYYSICQSAVERYFAYHVPCQYEQPPNNLTLSRGFKCTLVRAGHGDMHQMASKWRQDIWGQFLHRFNPDNFAWAARILREFQPLHGSYMARGIQNDDNPRQKAVRGHAQQMERFFSRQNLFSNSICLSCLFNAPTIRLRCGHVICHECALDFGLRTDNTHVQIDHCPLHPGRTEGPIGLADVVQLDPANAGLRVLVLDGGGVRGIVELCVLKAIEDYLSIPLQSFFDLVIGTSTGGIISLGFGHELWSVEECMQRFTSLVASAFTLRSIQKYKGVKYIERVIKRSKYRTRPFEEALRRVFSDSALFAPRKDAVIYARSEDREDADKASIAPSRDTKPLKVGVAAVSEAGRTPYLLSNYNVGLHHPLGGSNDSKPLRYERARPGEEANELRTWEAALATSAAPGFFKPFKSKRFDLPFMDGAILHNNPIQLAIEEARRLSEETNMNVKPDIVLSIGTGKPKDKQPSDVPEYAEHTASKSLSRAQAMMKHEKHMPFLQMLFTMVGYQIKLNIDCDRRYDQVAREWQKDRDMADRLHRINPDLGEEPPVLDAVDKVDSIAQTTRGWLQDKEEKRRIHAIACRLVASSFYFERRGNAGKGEGSSIEVNGAIKCRISEKAEVMALGEFLSSCRSDPTLVVINWGTKDKEIKLPKQTMVLHGRFDPVELDITVLGEDAVTSIELKLERQELQDQRLYRLSGFPRKLIKEDFKQSRMS